MKIIKRIAILILTVILCVFHITYGFDVSDLSGTDVTNNDVTNFGNSVITAISTIGSVVSVIALILIGIKYMIGSVEEKAEYKKSLMPYIIGCVVIFSASFLAGIIYDFATW